MLSHRVILCFCVCRIPPSPVPQVPNYINSAVPLQEQFVYENGEVSQRFWPKQLEGAREGVESAIPPVPAVPQPPPTTDGTSVFMVTGGRHGMR